MARHNCRQTVAIVTLTPIKLECLLQPGKVREAKRHCLAAEAHPYSPLPLISTEHNMKPLLALLVLMSLSSMAWASGTDEDMAAIKAQEKAAKESNAKFDAKEKDRKKQEAAFKKTQEAQTANAVRPMLGKAAVGKSDAEVVRMYEAKAQKESGKQPDEAAIRAKGDAQSRIVTGKSMQDMQNMSDSDLNKMEADLIKQYKR
jgi:hypothetical protein